MTSNSPSALILGGLMMIALTSITILFWNGPLGRWLTSRNLRGGRVSRESAERWRRLKVYPTYAFLALGVVMLVVGVVQLVISP